jgi:hypothetical protein
MHLLSYVAVVWTIIGLIQDNWSTAAISGAASVMIMTAMGLAYSCYRSVWRYALLRDKQSILGISLQQDGTLILHVHPQHLLPQETRRILGGYPATVCADSAVLPGLIVLRVRVQAVPQQRYRIVLPKDSLDKAEYHLLSLWLRCKAGRPLKDDSPLSPV